MNVLAALEFCRREGPPSVYSCAACMVEAAPKSSDLRKAFAVFETLPATHKVRCLRSVMAGARVVAMKIRSPRTSAVGEGPAWGIVDGGRDCFAFRSHGVWYARSEFGLARMPVERVKVAWELR